MVVTFENKIKNQSFNFDCLKKWKWKNIKNPRKKSVKWIVNVKRENTSNKMCVIVVEHPAASNEIMLIVIYKYS